MIRPPDINPGWVSEVYHGHVTSKGEVLISRLYRTDLKRSIADVFRIQVISNNDVRSPIITLGSTSFFHVRVNNLYLLAVTKNNANAALVFEFCYRFVSIARSYFGKLDEESVKSNFVLIYELIDEIIDFGFPQNSEIDTLKTYITTEGVRLSTGEESSKITNQATGSISWRRGDVKYKKNEAFVDVVETVNVLVSANNTVLRADVDGHIVMRAYLSGTPECKFGLNDKLVLDKGDRPVGGDAVELDDCHFHQCVRLNQFDSDRTISFIPPDGEFELMKYRGTTNISLPLRVLPTITEIGTREVSYALTVKANFNTKLSATNVMLRIPTPLNTTTVDLKAPNGKAKYVPAENVIVWKIPRLQGGAETTLTGTAALTAVTNRQPWARPPIDVDFQVLMFTASGLLVRFLKVFEKSNYNSVKWVQTEYAFEFKFTVLRISKNFIEAIPHLVFEISWELMFWRFGFHNASSIDSLLDRDDVELEEILAEENLLQECKAQNTRLIDYFQRLDVLQRLLGYVSGSIEAEGTDHFKFPYVATEVLCSDIWSIVEACMSNTGQLLAPFWDGVLDLSSEELLSRPSLASHFSKINGAFMSKKPAEPEVIERIIRHIASPAIADLLFRIIQLDEHPSGAGVLEWLREEGLIPRLIDLLSPCEKPEIHTIAADVIKGIITMSAPSPVSSALNDAQQHVPTCNCFARDLASKENISKILYFMLDEVPLQPHNPAADSRILEYSFISNEFPTDFFPQTQLPNAESATSSVINAISVIMELIRKNNSDYFEPYLFHNLRNRLIQVQQHTSKDNDRDTLEQTMKELVDRMGIVHLGGMLDSFAERLDSFQELLANPRSMTGPVLTTVGNIMPLTMERFRICELYAELLHCSNMALLNRPPGTGPLYDENGRLQGGLSALEELARVISIGNGDSHTPDDAESKELPVQSLESMGTRSTDSLGSDLDPNLSDHSSEDVIDEIQENDSLDMGFPISSRTGELLAQPSPSSSPISSDVPHRVPEDSTNTPKEAISNTASCAIPSGDNLKCRFIELNVVSTLLDFFFLYPWNNFLHGTVYDFIHQILTGRVDDGFNRDLIIFLFRDAKLFDRIIAGHEENDTRCRQDKGVRLGYMGHLTLISEDVISALEHYPEDLSSTLHQYAPQPAWTRYVNGAYRETKSKDTSLLGGGKPALPSGVNMQKGRWAKVDEADLMPLNGVNESSPGITGEFKSAISSTMPPKNTANFGPPQDEESTPSHFARYLAEEIHATPISRISSVGSFSDASDDDDDDDDGSGWLTRSSPFDFDTPSNDTSPFDDSFSSNKTVQLYTGSSTTALGTPFTFDEEAADGFGSLVEARPNVNSFNLDQDDSAFEFGDFQSAETHSDGESTPTGDGWTFENAGDHMTFTDSDFFSDLSERIGDLKVNDNDDVRTKHIRDPSISQF
ncbi:hypothetical protein Clacol_006546 [Clathrus columnatus]|uniref:MHD domain-containing protein n=1 Tax=Clathrus columnatus TaxID=1419009 RepID=A0AAV5AHE6_9AGAM|nr:hypothetical protein Clacol_006546 [Clathrus columnatus]